MGMLIVKVGASDEDGLQEVLCHWWALCPNPAVTDRHHAILGSVPICDECDQRLDMIEAEMWSPRRHD